MINAPAGVRRLSVLDERWLIDSGLRHDRRPTHCPRLPQSKGQVSRKAKNEYLIRRGRVLSDWMVITRAFRRPRRTAPDRADALVERICRSPTNFTGAAPQSDDITLTVLVREALLT
jgi:hypothetical protein